MDDINNKPKETSQTKLEKLFEKWCDADAKERRILTSKFRLVDLLEGRYPATSKYFRMFSAVELGQDYDHENDTEFPRRPGPASKLDSDELTRLEDSLANGARDIQTPHTLTEVRIELFRRKLGDIDGLNVVRQICRLCRKNHLSKATHAELFRAIWPDQAYDGRGDGSRIMLALDAAMLFCIENELPPMNVLVVERLDRSLTMRDTETIYETARYLGADVGSSPALYVSGEVKVAKETY